MKKKPVTLESIAKKLDTIDERLDGRVDSLVSTVGELAEAIHTGFTSVQRELAKKADKADLDRIEKRFDGRIDNLETRVDEGFVTVGLKIDDLREEVMGFTSDVHDELSDRITVLEKKRL